MTVRFVVPTTAGEARIDAQVRDHAGAAMILEALSARWGAAELFIGDHSGLLLEKSTRLGANRVERVEIVGNMIRAIHEPQEKRDRLSWKTIPGNGTNPRLFPRFVKGQWCVEPKDGGWVGTRRNEDGRGRRGSAGRRWQVPNRGCGEGAGRCRYREREVPGWIGRWCPPLALRARRGGPPCRRGAGHRRRLRGRLALTAPGCEQRPPCSLW